MGAGAGKDARKNLIEIAQHGDGFRSYDFSFPYQQQRVACHFFSVSVCTCVSVHMCVCMYVCIYVCTCVCRDCGFFSGPHSTAMMAG